MKRLALLALLAAAFGFAQARPAAAQQGQFVGVASCVNSGCHGSTVPLQSSRVLQNEYYTWLNSDRHARAYNVLFNDLSARIVKNMRLKNKAYQEKLCLDCHSTNVPTSRVSGRIDPEDGVQCEACHGPAGGWRDAHTEPGWTHEKSVSAGMFDLRDLRVRAHTCHRCHMGNAEKEVDHELIASGHPLLAFELDNYTETMPAHWTPRRETHGVPAWAVGQAMAFRDSLTSLARHARGDKWPEFADMSCANCHHSLEDSQWRQVRGWQGRAGLPAWSPKQWAVLRLIVDRASPSARQQLDESVRTVAARVARMNDPAGTATAAESAKRTIESVLPRLTTLAWRDADVRAMMRTIAADAGVTYDVQTAQQAALALQSLAAALTRNNPSLLKSPMTAALDAVFAEVQNKDRYEPARFAEKLRALRNAV
jgi:Cytochrome c554 and c-prime